MIFYPNPSYTCTLCLPPNPFISDAEAARGCMTERMLSAWQEAIELTSNTELSPYRVIITDCTIVRGAIGRYRRHSASSAACRCCCSAAADISVALLLLIFPSASARASRTSGALPHRLHGCPNAHKRNEENYFCRRSQPNSNRYVSPLCSPLFPSPLSQ